MKKEVIAMRHISLKEYNQKRKENKPQLLKIQDKIKNSPDRKSNTGNRSRSKTERKLLYKIAKEQKEKLFKKLARENIG